MKIINVTTTIGADWLIQKNGFIIHTPKCNCKDCLIKKRD